jgi:hypothetical protein
MIRVKTQLSVVIENRPGILTRICDGLASHKINIEGFSAYGETDHGIVRLITSDPDRAAAILADRGFLVTRNEVLAAKLSNRPAGLMRLARRLAECGVNIDYAYGSAAAAGRMATVYLRVKDPYYASGVLSGKAGVATGKKATSPAARPAARTRATAAARSKATRAPATARKRRGAGRRGNR